MVQLSLPEEVHSLLTGIVRPDEAISDQVKQVLLQIWTGGKDALTARQRKLEISSSEVAAIWSITHRRPLTVKTVQQAVSRRRDDQKVASTARGSGKATRRTFILGDILDVQVRERAKKTPGQQ